MIRKAAKKDIEAIMKVYEAARNYMIINGNPNQWGKTHPAKELIEKDILQGNLFVVIEDKAIHGVFAFIIGDEPTYEKIEGRWKSDKPYGTIHRIASSGIVKGIFTQSLRYCKEKCNHIRIDTHLNNKTMQHLVEKNGFEKCGTIYVKDGTPRIAFELCNDL